MTMTRGWRRLGAGVCVAGLLLAGCDGGGSGEDPDDPEARSPLAEFLGWDDRGVEVGGEREFTEEERQQHYDVQELIVECMADAGFEYHPEPFWGDQENVGGFEDPYQEVWELQQDDPEEFARQYGYAITTINWEEEVGPTEPAPSDNPNHAYYESLSDAAKEEYDKALHGDWEAIEEGEAAAEGGAVEVSPEEVGGCSNEAYGEVYGFGNESEEERAQFEPLLEEMEALWQRVEDDPRLAEARQAWSGCMAEAGYPALEETWEAQEEVHNKQAELYGWETEAPPAATPADGTGTGTGTVTEAQPTSEPYEPTPDELQELQDFELAIAWADYECQQEHDVEEVRREVQFELEEQFIEDHREELEEYRDFLEEQGAFR